MRVSLSLICGTQGRKGHRSAGTRACASGDQARSPQDAKCHLLKWPRGSSCAAVAPFSAFFLGKNTDKTEAARSRWHRQTRARTGTAAAWPGTQRDTRTGPGTATQLWAGMALKMSTRCWGVTERWGWGQQGPLFQVAPGVACPCCQVGLCRSMGTGLSPTSCGTFAR